MLQKGAVSLKLARPAGVWDGLRITTRSRRFL
jgi:hypothetical protein